MMSPHSTTKRLLALSVGAFFYVASLTAAIADEEVQFTPFPKGLSAKLVEQAWRNVTEYQSYIESTSMVPDHMVGLADVNGDQTPEIFARHSDDLLGFCDKDGVACRMHIYAYTSKGLFEIGTMMASEPVVISNTKTKNIKNLIIKDSDYKDRTYIWDGKRYVLR